MSLTKTSYSMIQGAPVNVIDFGADPTGTNDSTTAINNAFASLGTAGGRIYFSGGASVYKVSGSITIPASSGTIVIYGDGSTTIQSSYNGLLINPNGNQSLRISNLSFVGPGKTLTSSICFQGALTTGVIENINITNFYIGIDMPGIVGARLTRVNIAGCNIGIKCGESGFSNLLLIENCYVSYCTTGMVLAHVQSGTISETAIELNTTGFTGSTLSGFNFNGVWFEQNSSASATFTNSNVELYDCNFSDFQPTYTYAAGWSPLPESNMTIAGSGNNQLQTTDIALTGYNYNGTNTFDQVGGTNNTVSGYGFSYFGKAGSSKPFRNLITTGYGGASSGDIVGVMGVSASASDTGYVKQFLWNVTKSSGTSANAVLNLGYNSTFATNEQTPQTSIVGNIVTFTSASFRPGADNTYSLGESSYRWSTVYAATGTINTSDENQKQQVASLTTAEQNTAKAIKGLIKTFKFNDAVAKKGANARTHIGVMAQEVQSAFTANGLDANKYALFCSDTWHTYNDQVVPVDANGLYSEIVYQVNGQNVQPDIKGNYPAEAIKVTLTHPTVTVTQLGIRYEELLAFVISAI